MAFRRRRKDDDEPDVDDQDLDEGDLDDEAVEDEPSPPDRPTGPWDVDDVPDDGVTRLDLGSILVPGLPGVEIQVNVDEASGTVAAVTRATRALRDDHGPG